MALQKKRSNSSRLIVVGVVVLVVGVVGYVLFQQFFLGAGTTSNVNSTVDRTNRVMSITGEDILQDPRYQALVQFGTTPVEPQGTNPNPFQ